MPDSGARTLSGDLYWIVSGRNYVEEGSAGWTSMGDERIVGDACP